MLTEGVHVPRSRRAAGADGRRAAAEISPRRKRRATRSARPCTTSWSLRRNSSRRRWPGARGAKARGYLADRSLDAGDAIEIPPGLRAGRALCAEGASRRAGRQRRGHGRDRPADRRRRHPGALRPLPRPRDVSDHRFPRPHHRLRRPRAVGRRAGEISQLAGDAALSQGLEPLQRRGRAPGGARRRGADRGRGLCRRDRHGHRRLSGDGRAARHRAHRGPAWPALEDGRRADPVLRRRQGRPARRVIARSTWRCRG